MNRQKKVRYKVVKRRTRMSSIINGNSLYARRYIKGQEVYATPGTLGIFVFTDKTTAREWADCWVRQRDGYTWKERDLIVIPVLPIGRGSNIVHASSEIDSDSLKSFYDANDEWDKIYAEVPDNTMAFPGVYVLD